MQTRADILAIYQRNLARYEREGDEEKAVIERRLIARLSRNHGDKR